MAPSTPAPGGLNALLDEFGRLSVELYRACKLARDLDAKRSAVRERIRQLTPSGWDVSVELSETNPAPRLEPKG